MAAAAQKSGRDSSAIELIAVTKTHPPEAVQQALRAGIRHLGENKVQEARTKVEQVSGGIWHLIGHLQTNKVKVAVQVFDRIDSVDSLELAQEISKRAEAIGKTIPILMEINIAGESSKFGVKPEEASALAEKFNSLPRLELRGVMTLAPVAEDPEKVRPYFLKLRELRNQMERETGLLLPDLSMGMSHDFEVAIEEGSTMVRLGTILFGTRPKPIREGEGEGP